MFTVELYAKIRRAVMVEGLSRREAAKRFGVHRNTITKMLSFSVPPGYRRRERPASKKLGPHMAWIEAILESDSQVHKKQRHTAHRIFERLRDEQGFSGGYTIVREYVARVMLRRREMFVPLSHRPGHAQADFGEPPFVHLLVNDETLCPAPVLGDNDFGAAFVKIGHDGVAVESLGDDQHVEGQSLDERWHVDYVEAMPRQQFEQGVTCGSKMSGMG
jgi:transposase